MESSTHDELDESDDSSSEIEEIESVELGTSSYESSITTTSNRRSGVSQRSILNSLRSPRLSDLSKKKDQYIATLQKEKNVVAIEVNRIQSL